MKHQFVPVRTCRKRDAELPVNSIVKQHLNGAEEEHRRRAKLRFIGACAVRECHAERKSLPEKTGSPMHLPCQTPMSGHHLGEGGVHSELTTDHKHRFR